MEQFATNISCQVELSLFGILSASTDDALSALVPFGGGNGHFARCIRCAMPDSFPER
jgi:hypothetical protein